MSYRSGVVSKIASLNQTFNELKQSEEAAEEGEYKMALNSAKSGIWDRITDHEDLLAQYDVFHPNERKKDPKAMEAIFGVQPTNRVEPMPGHPMD